MKYYDVSMKVSPNMQVYKNRDNKKPVFRVASSFDTGSSHETEVTINVHTGTHMDFPLHMIKGGQTSSELDLDRLIREVKVFDLSHLDDAISKKDVVDLDINKNDFVIFKTRNSFENKFNFKFIYIDESAALYLTQKGIRGVGIDALGVERDQSDHMTHKLFFQNDVYIIEGLRLKEVEQKSYFMYALPIKMDDLDGLLLSVILVDKTDDQVS